MRRGLVAALVGCLAALPLVAVASPSVAGDPADDPNIETPRDAASGEAEVAAWLATVPPEGRRAEQAVPRLLSILKDEANSDGLRSQVLLRLGRMGSTAEPAVPVLLELAAQPGRVGQAALKSLVMLAPAEAEPVLTRFLDDPERRELAIEGTVALSSRSPTAMTTVDRLLREDPSTAVYAALVTRAPPNVVSRLSPRLRPLLAAADPIAAELLTQLLASVPSDDNAAALLDRLATLPLGEEPAARLASRLASMGPVGTQPLRELLSLPEEAARELALRALPMDDWGADPEQFLHDPSASVRRAAALKLQGATSEAILVEALGDERPVALAAANELARRQLTVATRRQLEQLADGHDPRARIARRALGTTSRNGRDLTE